MKERTGLETYEFNGNKWKMKPLLDPHTGEFIGHDFTLDDPGRLVKWRAIAYSMKVKFGVWVYRNEIPLKTFRTEASTRRIAKRIDKLMGEHETLVLKESAGHVFLEGQEPTEELEDIAEKLLSLEITYSERIRVFQNSVRRAGGKFTKQELIHEAGLRGELKAIAALINSLGIV